MANQLNHRKDEKIQLYRVKKQQIAGTTRTGNYRQFIYSEDRFMGGGLYANARAMTNAEIERSGLQHETANVKFIVNRNPKLSTELKVIYRGEIYDIKTIDDYDFRALENSFTAVLSEATEYVGDLFDDGEI